MKKGMKRNRVLIDAEEVLLKHRFHLCERAASCMRAGLGRFFSDEELVKIAETHWIVIALEKRPRGKRAKAHA